MVKMKACKLGIEVDRSTIQWIHHHRQNYKTQPTNKNKNKTKNKTNDKN
jgi:hypothetical protein